MFLDEQFDEVGTHVIVVGGSYGGGSSSDVVSLRNSLALECESLREHQPYIK